MVAAPIDGRTCAVCRRWFAARDGETVCGPACADAFREWRLGSITMALIVAELARPVPLTKGKAWLCLEPLPGDELARRRGLLRHGTEATG